MGTEYRVMGLFTDEARAVSAIEAIKDSPWPLRRVHSPVPSHKISDTLGLKKSKVGYFTLAGGIIGFFAGFLHRWVRVYHFVCCFRQCGRSHPSDAAP